MRLILTCLIANSFLYYFTVANSSNRFSPNLYYTFWYHSIPHSPNRSCCYCIVRCVEGIDIEVMRDVDGSNHISFGAALSSNSCVVPLGITRVTRDSVLRFL